MKKNSVMVKQVLMSILTVGVFTFGFTSCSEDTFFSAYGTLSPEQIMAGETFGDGGTRGFISDAAECLIRFIKSGGHFQDSGSGRILQMEGTIEPPKIHIKTGENKGDTVTVKSKIPYNVELYYTLKVDAWVKPNLTAKAIFNPLDLLKVDTKYFEGRLDGQFSMAPQMTLGISGKAELSTSA